MTHRFPRWLSVLMIVALTIPLFVIPTGATPAADSPIGDITTASGAAAYKLSPKLKIAVAAAAPTDDVNLVVYAREGTDLSPYMGKLVVRKYVMPNGIQAYFGTSKAGTVEKIASLAQVAAVKEMKYEGDLPKPLEDTPVPDIATLQARLAALKGGAWVATVTKPAADKVGATGWFDVLDIHKSRGAWNLGYTGDGVKVMVNDSGIDFAHPDLQGTQARDMNPASPYYGWPIAFDSYSMQNLAFDHFLGTDYIKSGVGLAGVAPDYSDTSTTRSGTAVATNPNGTLRAKYKTIGASIENTYVFSPTSKSGVYHFGSHPDTQLARLLGGERAAVLVVDEKTAGAYDTVYVDIDGDYSFTEEKAARKGDEIIFQDLNGDGYADLSGGMIYWITDGKHPLPASDWLWGLGSDVAGSGDLVAFLIMDSTEPAGNHGQQCASAVAAQGVINGNAPTWKPAGNGTPGTGLVQGGGKQAMLVGAGNHYVSTEDLEGWIFAAMGYDGTPNTADDVQIISNSWGYSGTDNDGWDYLSRSVDVIERYVNPTLANLNSMGNGGAGYGTSNSPGDSLGIGVAASTAFNSTNNFDSLNSIGQINYNDIMSWSDRGPSAVGDNAAHIAADGAFGTGDLELNAVLDGWVAWNVWGGTSRSAPVAAGNMALVYQAFKQKNGRWPTNIEARAILMAGADHAYNDGFVQGAGTINALRAVQIAAGLNGIFTTPDNWTFGGYRGKEYDSFAKIMHPGQTSTKQFMVVNQGPVAKSIKITDSQLVKIGVKEWDFTSSLASEAAYSQRLPNYLWNVTDWIPAGTDLMEVKAVFPFAEFDPDGNYAPNQSWRLVVYDWTDTNNDGKLWTDLNNNGSVNCPIKSGLPDWADPACEIEQNEYSRYGYGYDLGTAVQQRVKQPLERKHNGVFIGLLHNNRSLAIPATHMKLQINFYKQIDWPWLSEDTTVTVPAGGQATFNATMTVPPLAGVGLYEGFLHIDDGTAVSNIPVVANVAAFSTEFVFGGPPDAVTPYDNGQVYGYFDWSWRNESGDWRMFFVDVPDSTKPGTNFLIDTRWTGAKTDIDTIVMGPTLDCFSNGIGCMWPFSTFPGNPAIYGPYSLYPQGGSSRNYLGSGKWQWQTSTGGPREVVAAPAMPGLNLIALQNVLYDGARPEERFAGQVGTIIATPDKVDQFVGNATSGKSPVSVQSSIALAGLSVDAFGLGVPDKHLGLPQKQDDPNDPSTSSYKFPITIKHGAKLSATSTASAGDLDMFVLYDFNNDGQFTYPAEAVGSSTTSSANEFVSINMPRDGSYEVWVQGWNAAATTFDVVINAIQGFDMTISGLASGPFQPDQTITFDVNWTKSIPAGEAAEGLIMLGPPGASGALQIPIRLSNKTAMTKTVTLPAVADASLVKGQPTANSGLDQYLFAGANDANRSVIRFDLRSIATYPIQKALMKVYFDAWSGGGTAAKLNLNPVTTAWAENTVTWKTPWTVLGGDFTAPNVITPISSADLGTWKTFDITSWAQGWATDPASNKGVLMRVTEATSYTLFRFDSRQIWNPAWAPVLEVTYGIPE